MEIRNAKDNGNNTFDCEVNHPVFGWIPFTASLDDPEEFGKVIHEELSKSGKYEIKPYTPPSYEELAAQARAKRDGLLFYFDTELYRNQFYWESLTQEQRDERLAYRQALLDVPEQEGFPHTVVWPDFPML